VPVGSISTVGRDDADGSVGHILAQAGVHIAFGIARQVAAKLVKRAPGHGGAHHDVFAGGFFHEAFRGDDGDLALGHLLGCDHAQHAAKVVGMCVREHHCRYRFVTQMLAGKGQRSAGGFGAVRGSTTNPAGLAFDEVMLAMSKPRNW
jgi:hypothetical protein